MKLINIFLIYTIFSLLTITHAGASLPTGVAPHPGSAPNISNIERNENCWITVSTKYNIPPNLLFAIALVESGLNPTAVNVNRNGSRDFGFMQINDWWHPRLKKFGILPKHLADPCVSIHVGAWILAQNFHQMGYTWQAIGAYNARNPTKRWIYAQRVYAMYSMLQTWSAAYYDAHKLHHGEAPTFLRRPPEAWVQHARQAANKIIKSGMPTR